MIIFVCIRCHPLLVAFSPEAKFGLPPILECTMDKLKIYKLKKMKANASFIKPPHFIMAEP